MIKKRFDVQRFRGSVFGVLAPYRKLLLALGALAGGMLALALAAPLFVDIDTYRDAVEDIVRQKTGKEALIKGKIMLSMLPVPSVSMSDVDIKDADGDVPAPSLHIERLDVRIGLLSLFSGKAPISSLTLENPTLAIERAKDGQLHWGWITPEILGPVLGETGDPVTSAPVTVEVTGGTVLYIDRADDFSARLEDIALSFQGGISPQTAANFVWRGQRLAFKMNSGKMPGRNSVEGMPLEWSLIRDPRNTLIFRGTVKTSEQGRLVEGALAGETDDLTGWFRDAPSSASKKPKSKLDAFETDGQTEAVRDQRWAATPLPLKFNGELTQSGNEIRIGGLAFEGGGLNASGKAEMKWEEIPVAALALKTESIDLTSWRMLLGAMSASAGASGKSQEPAVESGEKNPFPGGIEVGLELEADTVKVGTQAWDGMSLSAKLQEGIVTINQLQVFLAGDANAGVFGQIMHTSRGVRFEGSVDAQGKSLREALAALDPSLSDLPQAGFGEFHIHSNLFIAAEQIRLSEAEVTFEDLRLSGGLAAYFDENPRVEAEVGLKDINFDYFRNVWRERQKTSAQKDGWATMDGARNFDWLRQLKMNVDFKVNVEGFTFLERSGDRASFRLYARPGEISIYGIHLRYPDSTLEASLTLDVKGSTPAIGLVLNNDRLEANYFRADPDAIRQPWIRKDISDEEKWSQELIDFSWMNGWNADFDVTLDRFLYDDLVFANVKMKTRLENSMLSIKNLSFESFQGQIQLAGSVAGGRVPGFSLSFTAFNGDVGEMIGSITRRDNLAGRVSLSGVVSTSGIDMKSWIKQLDAKIVMAGRGVRTEGFNLQGALDVVAASRTAADVFNNVNRVLPEGVTEFSVDGNLNIAGGLLKTPGITLKSGHTIGNMTGEVKLLPWTVALSTLFQFPSLASETVPTMEVDVRGGVDKTEMTVDTASLEAYVAKRIVGK